MIESKVIHAFLTCLISCISALQSHLQARVEAEAAEDVPGSWLGDPGDKLMSNARGDIGELGSKVDLVLLLSPKFTGEKVLFLAFVVGGM